MRFFLPVKQHMVSKCASKSNAIYAPKYDLLRVDFHESHKCSTTLFQISHIEFNSKEKISMDSMDGNSFTPST